MFIEKKKEVRGLLFLGIALKNVIAKEHSKVRLNYASTVQIIQMGICITNIIQVPRTLVEKL